MNYRILGKTKLRVSEVGFGAWGIGGGLWQGSDDAESMIALHRGVDEGMNFLDTALVYGDGHSERLIGKFLKERSERIYVSTKIPPLNKRWPAQEGSELRDVYPAEYIIECTHQSLRNLKVDTIDVQQFHVWQDVWTDEKEWIDAIGMLKEEGEIRFLGISINDHQPENALALIESGRVETVQVIYNIFDQTPEKKLFPACLEHDIGVIVRVPFDEGALTGSIQPDSQFDPSDFRARYFRGDRKNEVVKRVESLSTLLGEEVSSLPELALRFCLHHQAVSTVIPGMRSEKHVVSNCAVSDDRKITPKLINLLRHHQWDKNYYG